MADKTINMHKMSVGLQDILLGPLKCYMNHHFIHKTTVKLESTSYDESHYVKMKCGI